MKLHVVTFGCQMSFADSEEMARPLLKKGFSLTEELDSADAVLVNTCTVRQHAEDRAISLLGRLRSWKEERPERLLIVAGCAAERLGDGLRRKFPHVDLVVGAKSIEEYPEIVESALKERFNWTSENAGAWEQQAGGSFFSPSPASAYVTVMRGCNYSCTYCIVPSVRGRELYRPMETILREAGEKVWAGAKEIMLLGQTVNSYRGPGGEDFADLLRAVDGVPGARRIRFMSPHPHYLDDRTILAMAESPNVCRHLHLPLQSGSDPVLKRMRRNYTAAEYLKRLEALRWAIPGIEITTDVIVGFPGESEEDFERTLEVLGLVEPASAYCFKFSARPGTDAAAYDGQVSEEVKEERLARLLAEVEDLRRSRLREWIGRTVEVLLEDERHGKTEQFIPIRLEEPAAGGDIVLAGVTGHSDSGLQGRLARPASA